MKIIVICGGLNSVFRNAYTCIKNRVDTEAWRNVEFCILTSKNAVLYFTMNNVFKFHLS